MVILEFGGMKNERIYFSYKFKWHNPEPFYVAGEQRSSFYGGKFASEKDAINALRNELIGDIEKDDRIHHVRNGIVIVGEDEHCSSVITVRDIKVKALPVMHYGIYYDDENTADCFGKYETLDEAKANLEGWAFDSEIDMAASEDENIETEFDSDGLGFMVTSWTGDKDNPKTWFERTYRIHEIDEDGNWIDEE